MTEFDPGAANQAAARLAAIYSAERHGLGLMLKVGAAGLGLAAVVGAAATFESAIEPGAAAAAEVPITFTPDVLLTRDCSAEDVFLSVTVAGKGLDQGVTLNVGLISPSGAQNWVEQSLVPTGDSGKKYNLVFAPVHNGKFLIGQMPVEIIVNELDPVDNTTWYPAVAKSPGMVEACASTGKPTATPVPKPSHSAQPTTAPNRSAKPSPTQIPSLKPSPSPSVTIRPVTPTPTVEAVAPPASSEMLITSESASSVAAIESRPVGSQPASSNSVENSPSAPASVIALGNSSSNGSSGGDTLLKLGLGGLLGAGTLTGIIFFAKRRRKTDPGKPQTPQPAS